MPNSGGFADFAGHSERPGRREVSDAIDWPTGSSRLRNADQPTAPFNAGLAGIQPGPHSIP